jgi:Protein of unknown function (DUF732)
VILIRDLLMEVVLVLSSSTKPSNRRSITAKIAGTLAISAAVAAAVPLAPANADVSADQFLGALNNAGVPYGDSGAAVSMAQSICPMLSKPGGDFAAVASQMGGTGGLSPGMASLFTSIAISMYCPNMMASITNGDWLSTMAQFQRPGVPLGPMGLPGF